jgi:hypothetical protein
MSPSSPTSPASTPWFSNDFALPDNLAITSTSAARIAFTSSLGIRLGATTVPSLFSSSSCTPVVRGNIFSTTGARMNTLLNFSTAVLLSSPLVSCAIVLRNGRSSSASKDSTCRPKWLRLTRTSKPPMSSCPPFFVRFADSERRISPAQVPHVGFRLTLDYISSQSKAKSVKQHTSRTPSTALTSHSSERQDL